MDIFSLYFPTDMDTLVHDIEHEGTVSERRKDIYCGSFSHRRSDLQDRLSPFSWVVSTGLHHRLSG